MRRPRALAAWLERLEDRLAPAHNILQVDPIWINPPRINEYTISGTLVRSIDAPSPAEDGFQYLRDLTAEEGTEVLVLLPELFTRGWRRLLHNQKPLYVKRLLLFEPHVILASVPYQLLR